LNEYKIEFTERCLQKMAEIEEIPHIHEALEAVYKGLRHNPYVFNPAYPLVSLRAVKTQYYLRENFSVPPLVIYFTIIEDDKIVRILEVLKSHGFGELDAES
jgi:hypothetical protein